MKKLHFIIGALLISTTVFSQIVITPANFPKAGTVSNYSAINEPSNIVTFETASANGPWDFSSLVGDSIITEKIISINDISGGKEYAPTATIGIEEDGSIIFVNTENGLEVVGIKFPDALYGASAYAKINDFGLLMPKESKFNATYKDVMKMHFEMAITEGEMSAIIDSLLLDSRTNIDGKFNAEGTIKTPYGTFSALRLAKIESDSTEGKMHSTFLGGWVPMEYEGEDVSYSFEWFALKDGVMFSVLKLEYDNEKNPTSAKWYNGNKPVGIINSSNIASNSVYVYPTIAEDKLFVKAENNNFKASVYDISGRVVLQLSSVASGINVQNLRSGVYICKIFNANNEIIASEKFIKK